MPPFTEENVRRIMINPFYAITVAPQLTREHEPALASPEWVRVNALLIGEMGAERWLRLLLDVLEGKSDAPDIHIDPTEAVHVDPLFSTAHSPIIERDMWVAVNVRQMGEMGARGWLRQLLDVLDGDIVTAEEVSLTPPRGPFGYSAVGTSYPQRRKKKRKKRHHS